MQRTGGSVMINPAEMKPEFRPIDIDNDWELCLQFRIDSFVASFGSADNFYRDGGEEHYKAWLKNKIQKNPWSAVHIHFENKIIGQMEIGKIKSAPEIGNVNLYYLVPEYRGRQLSKYLDEYAIDYMLKQGHKFARLNVSPTNQRAVRFYEKNGWKDLGPNPQYPEVHLMEKAL